MRGKHLNITVIIPAILTKTVPNHRSLSQLCNQCYNQSNINLLLPVETPDSSRLCPGSCSGLPLRKWRMNIYHVISWLKGQIDEDQFRVSGCKTRPI